MKCDLHNNIEHRRSISPTRVSDNTAQVGQIIDSAGFNSVEYVIAIGTVADADATFVVLLEDGDDSSLTDAAAVADANLLGTEAGAGFQFDDDDEVRKLGYVGGKRYTRLTITPADNTGNADLSAVCLLGHPAKMPQTSQS